MNALNRRRVSGLAIDGLTSKDLDDAIDLRKEKDGYTVTVSISDVSHTVKKGSDIDLRAQELAFTRYFAQGNSPMLPRRLSENLLSLIPNFHRYVVVFEIRLNEDLEVIDVKIELGRFKAPRRFTHKQVDDILENKKHKNHREWMAYYKFAEALLNRRRKAGAMVIYDLSIGLYTTEEGQVLKKTPGLYFRSYIIVQEFMILANQAVTEYLGKAGVPLLYRNHAPLTTNTDEEDLLRKLYGSNGEELTPEVLAELNERVRKMVGRARYESSCKGHFGLNLPAYAHWTSPIRRYADLVNHRQLVAWLTKSPYPYTVDQIATIGDHINKMQDEVKGRTAGAYKAEAVEGLRNSGEAELLMLEKGRFSFFIRLLVEEEMLLTEMRAKVIRIKLQENALLLVDQVRILFSEVPDEVLWRQTQENVLQAMVANPVNVQATLQLAQTMMGWEPSVRHAQVSEGVFAAEITITRGERSYASECCEGHGKGDAEIKALVGLLQRMTSIHIEIPEGKKVSTDSGNHKGRLMEMCQQNRWPFPTFDHSQTGPSNQPLFTCVAELERPGEEKLVTEACKALTKKAAERMASKALLTLLGVKDHNSPASTADSKAVAGTVPTDWRSNPISALQEYCQKKGYNMPEYSDQRSGQDHTPNFTLTCVVTIDGAEQSFQAEGPNKKEAKRNAAAKACEQVFAKAA